MIILSERCKEGSAYPIPGIQFVDDNGDAVVPNSDPTWTLCNEAGIELYSGTIAKSLSMNLVLSGDQTLVTSSELGSAKYETALGKKIYYVVRTVTIRGLVNSTLGNNLAVTEEFVFLIDNMDCIG